MKKPRPEGAGAIWLTVLTWGAISDIAIQAECLAGVKCP
jgi:hypothetical protein